MTSPSTSHASLSVATSPPERTARGLVVLEWLLSLCGAVIHAVLTPHVIYADAQIRYETLLALVKDGAVSPARYSILQSLLAVPFYWLGDRFGLGAEAVAHFCVTVFITTLVACYFLLRGTLAPSVLRRMILLLLAASMFGRHLQTFYGETLTASAVLLAIAALVTERPVLAGLCFCVGVVNTPTALLGLVLCTGTWALWTRRWLHAAWPVVLTLGLIFLEFWWRRGSPFASGYDGDAGFPNILPTSGQPGFSNPLLFGVLAQLFSFGKGVLLFAPGLLLYWARRRYADLASRRFALLGLMFCAGLVLAYAKWWSWYGGWFWGPRFLLFASVPASYLIAEHLREPEHRFGAELTLGLALLWSGWVAINGAVFDQTGMEPCMEHNFRLEPLCWYVPEFSALFRPFFVEKPLDTADKVVIVHAVVTVLVLWLPRLPALGRASFRAAFALARRGF